MTDDPAAFAWSSCPAHCGQYNPLVTHHAAYLALGASAADRAQAYRTLLDEALPDTQVREIRAYLQQQRALGRDEFQAMVEAKTRRFAVIRPAHHPRKFPVDK